MSKAIGFKNRDRVIQIGITISVLKKLRGMSQEELAEKAGISRSQLSIIEAPNMTRSFSLKILFNIADALEIPPSKLLESITINSENKQEVYNGR